MMSDRLTSRKFIIAVLSLVSLSVLCLLAKIDGGEYITGLLGTVGAYLAANVTQKAVA
jgi:hypothetical protein